MRVGLPSPGFYRVFVDFFRTMTGNVEVLRQSRDNNASPVNNSLRGAARMLVYIPLRASSPLPSPLWH